MSDENKIPEAKKDVERIKKLEVELKTAFKEERFEDVRKLGGELKSANPENHLAKRLMEKVDKASADKSRRENLDKINNLEKQMKEAFSVGRLMDIAEIAGKIKKIEPENKVVKKMEARIGKAKASLDAQVKKDKIKVISSVIKELMNNEKWDDAAKKANEILDLDWGNSSAYKALKKIAKIKNVELKNLVTVTPPKKEDKPVETQGKKPGFFSKLFKKKEESSDEKLALVKAETKEDIKTDTKLAAPEKSVVGITESSKPVEVNNVDSAAMPAKAQVSQKDEIKQLEESLKHALKDDNIVEAKSLIEEIKKIDPENKPALKAQIKLDKDKEKFEKKVLKEKIKGLSGEIKDFIKIEDWKKIIEKSNELLKIDEKNSLAIKSIKKAEEKSTLSKAEMPHPEQEKAVVQESGKNEKGNIFKQMFNKNTDNKKEDISSIKAPISKPVTPPAPMAMAPKPVTPPAPMAMAPVPVQNSTSKITTPIKPVMPTEVLLKAKPMVTTPLGGIQKPATPVAPIMPAPKPATPVSPTSVAKKAETSSSKKGNIFTKLFNKKVEGEKPTESIIETIVAQTDQTNKVKREVKKKVDDIGERFLKFSNLFLRFSIVFIIISAAFFYIFNVDKENRTLALFGKENNAYVLKGAAEELDGIKKDEKNITKEIEKYKKGYKNEYKDTIDYIISNRMNWSDLLNKLNEVTESVYAKNALAEYVKYNNYSYDVVNGRLTVSATLSDPMGKNLTKLAELEEAFMYYPQDKDNPNEDVKPYFYNMQGFNSYSKALNQATGRYTSNFSLSLSTKEDKKKK